MTRVASSTTRRAYVAPGVPGVWHVPKRRPAPRRGLDTFDNPWIQGPDFEVTYTVGVIDSWQYAVVTPTATEDADIAQLLKDGTDLTGVDLGGGPTPPRMALLFSPPDEATRTTNVQSKAAQVSGSSLGDLGNAVAGGFYTHPDPDPGYELEYENVAGVALGDLTLAGEVRAVSGDEFTAGGQMRWTLEDNLSLRTVAHMLLEYALLGTWPEQGYTPFEFVVPTVDVFGGDRVTQASRNMRIHVITDAVAEPGSGGETVVAEASEADHEAQINASVPFTVTVTVRPPRHRFVSTVVGDWTPSVDWGGFVWDAGLFLGTGWADVTGLPTSTPTGCEQLNFYVAPATSDVVANDQAEPFGRFYRNSDGSSGEIIAPDPGTPPEAGSHIWVVWFGPTSNPNVDPVPGVSPASLIPASLAENGEA